MTFLDRLYPAEGLRVLVTAGASGIGAAIASAFAETGAAIHICDVDDMRL
jgi:NAD(P)-dependent dehydrogenase (short-subunit alcohol dehydrogenase family)